MPSRPLKQGGCNRAEVFFVGKFMDRTKQKVLSQLRQEGWKAKEKESLGNGAPYRGNQDFLAEGNFIPLPPDVQRSTSASGESIDQIIHDPKRGR